MPVKEITHVCVHIIDVEKKRVMAMSDAERMVHMNSEMDRQSKREAWSSDDQNLNPFPKWVRQLLAKVSTSKPRFDPLNKLYYIAVDGDMADAYEWMEEFDEALKKETEDADKLKWSTDNCLKASITDADEAANMADLEGFLRGSAPDYHRPKDEKDAQDEGSDEEVVSTGEAEGGE